MPQVSSPDLARTRKTPAETFKQSLIPITYMYVYCQELCEREQNHSFAETADSQLAKCLYEAPKKQMRLEFKCFCTISGWLRTIARTRLVGLSGL